MDLWACTNLLTLPKRPHLCNSVENPRHIRQNLGESRESFGTHQKTLPFFKKFPGLTTRASANIGFPIRPFLKESVIRFRYFSNYRYLSLEYPDPGNHSRILQLQELTEPLEIGQEMERWRFPQVFLLVEFRVRGKLCWWCLLSIFQLQKLGFVGKS